MRRLVIALILSIAAVAPGVAWQAAQDREAPPNWRRDNERQSPGEISERLRSIRGVRGLGPEPIGLCEPNFGTNISDLLFNAPGNGWVLIPGDCSNQPGCNDFFFLSCDEGSVVQASFCSNGGEAFWNTNLSVWDGANLELCEDDSCGQQSAISYPYFGGPYHRFRIGGTDDDSGSYSLAVNIPANCAVGPPIGVELQSFDLG